MPHRTLMLALFLLLLFPANIIGLWWAVGSPLHLERNRICKKSRRLAGKQKDMCPDFVEEVIKGTKLGTGECQHQFKNRRWNCSTSNNSFGKILLQDIRETAFVCAVTSAGVTYAITQACSMGDLLQCGCDDSMTGQVSSNGTWEWGGCADNIEFGYQRSKDFMDVENRKRDVKTLVNLHNNEAGRMAIKDNMRVECKCHGLSGSCTVKTCWKKMPVFRDVGNILKQRFNGAAKVIGGNDGEGLLPVGDDSIKPPGKQDLVYIADSPNFCKPNRKVGSLGTAGRKCNSTSIGVGGCDLMCCERGYKEEVITVKENCRCRFHWCCVVNCETCTTKKTIHTCNGYK
ncbi:protein Wnt-6-like [Glandiceps talaboti]